MAVDPSVFLHARALCESEHVGPNTRVWAFAHVMAGARVGADCNICDHVFIEGGAELGDRVTVKNNVMVWDGVTVEDDVFLGPNAVLTNDRNPRVGFRRPFQPTVLRAGATIGANATLVCPLIVGRRAFVGAGAVVLQDVPDHALVVGNPAARIGWVCACAERLADDLTCSACGSRYARSDEHAGLTLQAGPQEDERA